MLFCRFDRRFSIKNLKRWFKDIEHACGTNLPIALCAEPGWGDLHPFGRSGVRRQLAKVVRWARDRFRNICFFVACPAANQGVLPIYAWLVGEVLNRPIEKFHPRTPMKPPIVLLSDDQISQMETYAHPALSSPASQTPHRQTRPFNLSVFKRFLKDLLAGEGDHHAFTVKALLKHVVKRGYRAQDAGLLYDAAPYNAALVKLVRKNNADPHQSPVSNLLLTLWLSILAR